jgi:hypothetical protein
LPSTRKSSSAWSATPGTLAGPLAGAPITGGMLPHP